MGGKIKVNYQKKKILIKIPTLPGQRSRGLIVRGGAISRKKKLHALEPTMDRQFCMLRAVTGIPDNGAVRSSRLMVAHVLRQFYFFIFYFKVVLIF